MEARFAVRPSKQPTPINFGLAPPMPYEVRTEEPRERRAA